MTVNMLHGENLVREFSVESHSRAGRFYQVILWSNDRFTCNCPAFTVSVRNRGKEMWERDYCKHIDEVLRQNVGKLHVSHRNEPSKPKEPEVDPKLLSIMNSIKWDE